jgi:low temperature requirement protein LtrA
MRYIFWSRPVLTEETHRATTVEIFFDLVFAFALTRVITFMGHPPTPLTLAQGLILLLLLWMAWTTYTWLGNQARADVGLIAGGVVVAMAAIFVAALVIPDAWRSSGRMMDAPLALALCYVVLRGLDIGLYFEAATGNPRLRTTLRFFAITTTLAWIPLIVGAHLGGTTQTLLWAAAFITDFGGGFLASGFSGWLLPSPSHFTERHGLVLMIALGESLISVGAGAGVAVVRAPVMLAALLGFTVAVCLWWFYFRSSAAAAGEALGRVPPRRRGEVGSNAYSLAHFLLIAGVIYVGLGIEQVISRLAHGEPRRLAEAPLDWTSTGALYGGTVLYLIGRVVFLQLSVRSSPPAQLVAAGTALALLPIARILPALAALGLLAAFLVALVCYERFSRAGQSPTA